MSTDTLEAAIKAGLRDWFEAAGWEIADDINEGLSASSPSGYGSGAEIVGLSSLAEHLAEAIRARDPLAAEAIEGEGEDAALVKRRIVDVLRRQAVDDAEAIAGANRVAMEARRAHLAADELAEQALGLLRVVARGQAVDNLAAVVADLDGKRVAAFDRMTRETTP